MKLCKLLLPPMDVRGERYTEVGAQLELTDGDAEMFAGCGVVEVLGEAAPETPAAEDAPEVVEPTEEPAAEPEAEPAAPAKTKAKR